MIQTTSTDTRSSSIPFDQEREHAIIASIIGKGHWLFEKYQGFLNQDDFLDWNCREAWLLMEKMWAKKQDWTSKMVYDRPKDTPEYRTFEFAPPEIRSRWLDPGWQIYYSNDLQFIADVCRPLVESRIRRTVAKWAENLRMKATEGMEFDLRGAMNELGAIDKVRSPFAPKKDFAEVAAEAMEDIYRRYRGEDAGGLPSHISALNKMIGGFRPGNLIVVGALTSGGKTAFGVNTVWHANRTRVGRVLMFSTEMTEADVFFRLLSLESGVPAERLITNARGLSAKDLELLADAASNLSKARLVVNAEARTVDEIENEVRRNAYFGPIELVVVDYLQYIEPHSQSDSIREQTLRVTKALKAIAKDYSVPVMAMAQLNRSAHDAVPGLKHFQESSQIEKEADIALILFRSPDTRLLSQLGIQSNGEVVQVMRVAKNRNGRTGAFRLNWNPTLMLFSDGV